MNLSNLGTNKASHNSNTSMKIVKESIDIFSDFVCTSFTSSKKTAKLPGNLEPADVTPIYKKGKTDIKGNYRPVSIFTNLSKTFEKCIFQRISHFMTKYCQSINVILGKVSIPNIVFWKKLNRSVDNGKDLGALLTDLSKAFYCLNYELIIAKLNLHEFGLVMIICQTGNTLHKKNQTTIVGIK